MSVHMSLGGSSTGDGFLLTSGGANYDADLALWSDSGPVSVTLQASPNPANLVFSQTTVTLSATPTVVKVHATAQSASRGDTTIQALDGAVVAASFAVTSIKHPVVGFSGRFEARFATDNAYYNTNHTYMATIDTVVPPGWTWALEGEPDFVPSVGNVPENLETPVGRVVRYNNPVALRSHAAAVVSTVQSISGQTTAGTEVFTAGDPLIGQLVNLGPNTYLAGNNPVNPADPTPEESWTAAEEPMALFELHLGSFFGGASQVGPFTHKTVTGDEHTRSPDSRPIANGFVSAATDLSSLSLPSLTSFSDARLTALVADYDALPAGASTARRNLVRRIGHLFGAADAATVSGVQSTHPGVFTSRQSTLTQGWPNKEIYQGIVDANLSFNPNAGGGAVSSVINYLSGFSLFGFESHMFAFHSDELCGYHHGTLQAHVLSGGTYTGDPHTQTVDGTLYDFQAVGEFTLLKGGSNFEVQVRQWPVAVATPVTDAHSGLTSCVSLIVAAAARVGDHRIAIQPTQEHQQLEFYLDGRPMRFPTGGLDLGAHRVVSFDANGEQGIRVDYGDGSVLAVTPEFWPAYNLWYLNVSVAQTSADHGIMGAIPQSDWLPRLRNGANMGPRPASLHDRYVALYKTFADSWRVTEKTSLFVYASGTSTKTFTDHDWPAEKPPCKLKPEFQVPGVGVAKSIPIEEAELICRIVTDKQLNKNCVFDVATTGNKAFAQGYRLEQELKNYGTVVRIEGHAGPTRGDRRPDLEPKPGEAIASPFIVTATVVALSSGRPTPTGTVTFYVDGLPMKRPSELDGRGRARFRLRAPKRESHTIRAVYSGGGKYDYHSSSSPNLIYTAKQGGEPTRQK